ncbi:hypothetical protein [Streptomyces minutiscleroticus]|uniref:Uncharacterized protein n=1 Tax=Streptomyces minutiscleroticus TaxID=68238 RepID=A0A918U445_9ACTN|nr:hypothetical protein [Streptomyces minutiscleroticus]GGX89976.1 hypothetical protein GCM10010358_49960 [Streptomyces minutiscleroticus]
MPALNVEFSESELEDLRAIAREQGVPMKAFVRASAADAIAHHRALREGAAVFQRIFADPDLASAIAAAGIDDGPAPGPSGRAA